jgi:hypothetical protein
VNKYIDSCLRNKENEIPKTLNRVELGQYADRYKILVALTQ